MGLEFGLGRDAKFNERYSALMPDNVLEFEALARAKLDDEPYAFLAGAADDGRTLDRNSLAFHNVQIRTRRMIDVTHIDTSITLLGESLPSPIILAPVGVQGIFHPDGELASAKAAARKGHLFISATLSNHPLAEVFEAYGGSGGQPWFQLYTTADRKVSAGLLDQVNACGCRVCVLTVDVPVLGNRESQRTFLERTLPTLSFGNLDPLGGFISPGDAALTWDIIPWFRQRSDMKLLLKGIVTREDALLAIEHGVDGIIVSNHGGRQEESDRATIESLPEVVEAVAGRVPVIFDSGIRRGTDVFKALALGASAVAIGRPYIWGLAAAGQSGVEQVLDILDAELIHIMRLAGTTSIDRITGAYVMR